jgi:hypothetical protein
MPTAPAFLEDGLFYPARDAEAVLELRRQVWGDDHPHNTAAFYHWLASGDALDAPQGVLLRGKGEEAVGFASLCVKPFFVDGQALKLAHGLDYMVRSDRRQGRTALRIPPAWQALGRSRGCSFGISFPNDKSHRILNSERVGFSSIFVPRLMIRPLSSARPHGRLAPRIPEWVGKAALSAGAIASTALAAGRPRGGGSVAPVAEFGPEFDRLWREASRQLRVAIIRDSRYLNWRYRSHPIYSYRALSLRRNGELSGFIVTTQRNISGLNACLIVDLLVRDWNGSDASELVNAVIDAAQVERLDAVATLCIPGGALCKVLRRSGFLPIPDRVAPRAFRTSGVVLLPRAATASAAAAWHFTWGDSDVV